MKEERSQSMFVNNHKTYNKVFCIGFNKTGTTSLEYTLGEFGFSCGSQWKGELLIKDWNLRGMEGVESLRNTAEVFQDVPFSLPKLYESLDQMFPQSKFILTVRDSEHQWYSSLTNFHAKVFASNKKKPPTPNDLMNATYVYRGWALDFFKIAFDYPAIPLYDEEKYKSIYLDHINDVRLHFKGRKKDLLLLNLADPNGFSELVEFLEIKDPSISSFPKKNKTEKGIVGALKKLARIVLVRKFNKAN